MHAVGSGMGPGKKQNKTNKQNLSHNGFGERIVNVFSSVSHVANYLSQRTPFTGLNSCRPKQHYLKCFCFIPQNI